MSKKARDTYEHVDESAPAEENSRLLKENLRLQKENQRLQKETQQHSAELAIISSIGEAMNRQLDIPTITRIIGDKVRDIFKAVAVEILLFDPASNMISVPYSSINNEYLNVDPFPLGEGLVSKIISSGSPLFAGSEEELIEKGAIIYSRENELDKTESYMGVPVIAGDKILGVVSVQATPPNAFSENSLRLLQIITAKIAMALENARLFEETKRLLDETQQRNAELSLLNTIHQGLAMKMDFNGIIDLVGDKLREALSTGDIGIRIYDQEKNLLYFMYQYEHGKRFYQEPMAPRGLSSYVIKTGKMLYLKRSDEEYIRNLGIEGMLTVPGTDRSKSAVITPIKVKVEVHGVILIENHEREEAFSESDLRLIETLANSMSIALENARLFDQTKRLLYESEQRTAELSILNTIQQGLVMEMSYEGIINLVGDKLRETLHYQDVGIRIYDKKTDLFSYPYEYEHGEKLELEPSHPGAVTGWVLKNKRMFHLRKNDDESLKELGLEGLAVIPGTDRSKSLVAFPIMSGDEVYGMFSIENYELEDAFSDSDIRLFTTIASSMSIALEHARLFEETKRLLNESNKREAELSTINNISQALTAHLELDKLIHMVGDRIRELFKAEIVYLALLDKDTNIINFPYGYGEEFPPMQLGQGLTSKIIQTGEPLLINRSLDEKTAELGIVRVGKPAASYLGVPIPVGERIIGVISIQSTEQENYFTEDDMRLLNTVAANIGVALNNAEAYQKLNKTVGQLNKALNDLKSTQQQLIVQEKLASLGTLTAGIAHEIKNPLNFVNNFAEISIGMADDLEEELEKYKNNFPGDEFENIKDLIEDLKENSRRINQHGKRADSIVRSMLLHSRGKAGDRQETDINAMLEEDLNLAFHGMRARDASFNVTIEKDFDSSIGRISIVPQDISRVFINVINNGFYEVNKKKQSSRGIFRPTIWVTTRNLKEKIEIHIRDNGSGIPKEIQDKLFSPFFTTKPSGEGTGLGLSLSYDIIVKQHQGDIRFESKEGEFTEFIITLPRK